MLTLAQLEEEKAVLEQYLASVCKNMPECVQTIARVKRSISTVDESIKALRSWDDD